MISKPIPMITNLSKFWIFISHKFRVQVSLSKNNIVFMHHIGGLRYWNRQIYCHFSLHVCLCWCVGSWISRSNQLIYMWEGIGIWESLAICGYLVVSVEGQAKLLYKHGFPSIQLIFVIRSTPFTNWNSHS
jgi:hypothetical protein